MHKLTHILSKRHNWQSYEIIILVFPASGIVNILLKIFKRSKSAMHFILKLIFIIEQKKIIRINNSRIFLCVSFHLIFIFLISSLQTSFFLVKELLNVNHQTVIFYFTQFFNSASI